MDQVVLQKIVTDLRGNNLSLENIYKDAAGRGIPLAPPSAYNRQHLEAAKTYIDNARKLDAMLARHNYPPVVTDPQFEAIKYFSALIPDAPAYGYGQQPQQQTYGMSSINNGFTPVGVSASPYNMGVGYEDNTLLQGSRYGGSDYTKPAAPVTSYYDTIVASEPATETKKVELTPDTGNEYPLYLASGLKAEVVNLGNLFRYEVVGTDTIVSRMNDAVSTIEDVEYDSKEFTKKPLWYLVRGNDKTMRFTMHGTKNIILPVDHVELNDLALIIKSLESVEKLDYAHILKAINRLHNINFSLSKLVNSMITIKLIEINDRVCYSPFKLKDANFVSDIEDVVNVVIPGYKKALVKEAAELVVTLVLNYAKEVITNITTEIIDDECLFVVKDPRPTLCITNEMLVDELLEVKKGERKLLRRDSHKFLFTLLTQHFETSEVSTKLGYVNIMVVDELQAEVTVRAYLDKNKNYCLVNI